MKREKGKTMRLIDADHIDKRIDESIFDADDNEWMHAVVANAPTIEPYIIEAEAYVKGIDAERKRLLKAWEKPTVDKDYLVRLIQESVYDGEACSRLMDMVEPKQGEWILINPNGVNKCYACSECGNSVVEKDNVLLEWKYCSNCGSKMQSVVSNIDTENAKYTSDCAWR